MAYIPRMAEHGTWEIINQSIGALSDFLVEIPLKRADYTFGFLIIYIPNSVLATDAKRRSSFIVFGTADDDAIARSSGMSTTSISTYIIKDHWIKGYSHSEDGKLSDNYFSTTGRNVHIKRCRINGDKLELVFTNTYGHAARSITMRGKWQVER